MKDLTCDDLERQNKAQSAADEFLKRHRTENALDSDEDGGQFKTNFNRTVISKGRKEGKLHPSSSTLDQIERRLVSVFTVTSQYFFVVNTPILLFKTHCTVLCCKMFCLNVYLTNKLDFTKIIIIPLTLVASESE